MGTHKYIYKKTKLLHRVTSGQKLHRKSLSYLQGFLEGNFTDLTHQSQILESTTADMKNMLYKCFCGYRVSFTKSDKTPPVMSLECVGLERSEKLLLISARGYISHG